MSSVGSFESSEDRSEDSVLHQQDLLSTSSLELEDIQEAINGVKRTILETEVSSQARKDLVHKLIRLRIKKEDVENRKLFQVDGEEEHEGHMMVPCDNISATRGVLYCGECGGTLWYLLQTVYICKLCSHLVHHQCLSKIRRKCVGWFLTSQESDLAPKYFNGELLMSICPELSLVEQNFKCGEEECEAQLTVISQSRLCDYTGQYYCSTCHWGARVFPSPARICHNWDFSLRAMAQPAIQYLNLVLRRPLINLVRTNPSLPAVVQEVATILRQRQQLLSMKKYLQVCRIAGEELRLLTQLQDRQHFVDSAEMFSLQDLMDINTGVLAQYLTNKLETFKSHIISCILCMAKSFVCEICPVQDKECLFPFDEGVEVCEECEAVFHRECFRSVLSCPRCDRKKEKKDASFSVFTVDMD